MQKPELLQRDLPLELVIDLDSDGELRAPAEQTADTWFSPEGKQKAEHRSGRRRTQDLVIGVLVLYAIGIVAGIVASSIAGRMPLLSQILTGSVLPGIAFLIFMTAAFYFVVYKQRQE